MTSALKAPAGPAKCLSFSLAGESYALDILKVREIVGLMPITPVPRSPEHVRGVVNLRGKIIPVVDARSRFGLGLVEAGPEACIITCESEGPEGPLLAGLLVDGVEEVLALDQGGLEPMPGLSDLRQDYAEGLFKHKGRVVILLKVEAMVNGSHMADPN